jgi:hypothetical protein
MKRLGVTAYGTTNRTHVSKGAHKERERASKPTRKANTYRRSASCGTCEHEFNEAWSVFKFRSEWEITKRGVEFDAQKTYLHSSTALSWKRSKQTGNDKTCKQTSNWSGPGRVRCVNSTHEALVLLLSDRVHRNLCKKERKYECKPRQSK